MGTKKSSGVMEMFYILMVVVVVRPNTFVKMYKDVHLQLLNFIVKKLYSSKAGKTLPQTL